MARKNTKKADKTVSVDELPLKDVLYALDTRNYNYYKNLPDELKKKYSPFILSQFMSSAVNTGGLHEFHVQMVNYFVNSNLWDLSKHPELQHLLLCLCGTGSKQFHKWISAKNKTKMPIWVELFQAEQRNNGLGLLNKQELYILSKTIDSDQIYDMAVAQGYENTVAKKYQDSLVKGKLT